MSLWSCFASICDYLIDCPTRNITVYVICYLSVLQYREPLSGAFRAGRAWCVCVCLYHAAVRSGPVGPGAVAGSPCGRSDRRQRAAEWLQPENKTPWTSHRQTECDLLHEEHHTYTHTHRIQVNLYRGNEVESVRPCSGGSGTCLLCWPVSPCR